MTKITSSSKISGAVGPVYYRVLNGKVIMQTKPSKGKEKRKPGTRHAASEFGRLSAAGKKIRTGLHPILMGWQDTNLFTRFNSRLYDVLRTDQTSAPGKRYFAAGNLALLEGFECNIASLFTDYSAIIPTVFVTPGNEISISIAAPASGLLAKDVEGASGCELCVYVAVFDADSLDIQAGQYMFRCDIGAIGNADINWQTPSLIGGSMVLLTTALLYYRIDAVLGKMYINGKGFHPCRLSNSLIL